MGGAPMTRPLITTEQLASLLGDPNLRLYDCTTYNEPVPPGSDVPYRAVPGDKTFAGGHIPGGGFDKWKEEGRPIETGAPEGYPATTFKATPRAGFFVDKTAVKARIGDPATVIVNALGPPFHRGFEPSRYGRPGRVPGSVNVP